MLSKYWTITSKPQAEAHSGIFELKAENIAGECVVQNQFLTINPNQKPMHKMVNQVKHSFSDLYENHIPPLKIAV